MSTQINGLQIKDNTIGVVDLSATGVLGSTVFLRGDNTWATPTLASSLISISKLSPSSNVTIADGEIGMTVGQLQLTGTINLSILGAGRLVIL